MDKEKETLGFRWALMDRVCGRTDFPLNRQNIHTPWDLCKEMLGKLPPEAFGEGKTFLAINIEYVEVLCYDFGVKRENVWFVTDCQQKANVIKHPRFTGVNVIVIDYLNWDNNMKFDVIVGNPPYNNSRDKANGDSLWPDFVKKSFELLKKNGYLCLIHPPGWRKPGHELWNIVANNQIKYLSIYSKIEGTKLFGATTRCDWYILQKTSISQPTTVNDELGNTNIIDLRDYNFLPNYMFETIGKVIGKTGDKKCEVIYNYNYGVNIPKDWISVNKSEIFKYPLVHALNNDGMRCYYSTVNTKGHFGIPKVILNDGEIVRPINDFNGEYGMTQHCFALVITSKKEGDLIVAAINTSKFKEVIKATKWSNFQTDYKMFKYFRKDFWNQFVDEGGNELK